MLNSWNTFCHMIDYLLPDGVMRPGRSNEVTFNKNNGDMKVKYNPPQDDDKNNTIN